MSHHQVSLSEDRELTIGDKRAGEAARKLHSMVQSLCIAAASENAQNRAHVMLMFAQAANGLLHMVARSVMPDSTDDVPITSTATLFAALLAYHTAPCEYELGKVSAEFSPLVIFDALKDFEKLAGQRPDEQLHEAMCRVARECAADPAMIAKIGRARNVVDRMIVGEGHTSTTRH